MQDVGLIGGWDVGERTLRKSRSINNIKYVRYDTYPCFTFASTHRIRVKNNESLYL